MPRSRGVPELNDSASRGVGVIPLHPPSSPFLSPNFTGVSVSAEHVVVRFSRSSTRPLTMVIWKDTSRRSPNHEEERGGKRGTTLILYQRSQQMVQQWSSLVQSNVIRNTLRFLYMLMKELPRFAYIFQLTFVYIHHKTTIITYNYCYMYIVNCVAHIPREKLISLKRCFLRCHRFMAICWKTGSRSANLISLLAIESVPAALG